MTDPIDPEENMAQTVERLTEKAQRAPAPIFIPPHPPGRQMVAVPDGYTLQEIRELSHCPQRIIQHLRVKSLASLRTYIERFMDPDTTVLVHGDAGNPFIGAVLDYHTEDQPSHCSHTVRYSFDRTEEWKAWHDASGNMVAPLAFAHFIEDHADAIGSVGEGDQALQLLETARGLKATRRLAFEQEHCDHTGSVRFVWAEETEGRTRTGVDVPDEFAIVVEPFYGLGRMVEIRAKFQYRIDKDAGLCMGFRLIGVAKALDPLIMEQVEELDALGLPRLHTHQPPG